MFLAGACHSDGSKTYAALKYFIPSVRQETMLAERLMASMESWGKRSPQGSRDPQDRSVILAIIGDMIHRGQRLDFGFRILDQSRYT